MPRYVAGEIARLQLSPAELILLLLVFYMILGCFLEGMRDLHLRLAKDDARLLFARRLRLAVRARCNASFLRESRRGSHGDAPGGRQGG